MNQPDFDIGIIGSGFAGSLMAMIARKLGRKVVLIERGRHPRFAIGESSTPLANLLLEELSHRYDLPRIAPLAKWGTWQKTYPQIGCGLKRGFTFYHHRWGQPWGPDPDHQAQLIVAASPRDEIADTHWYRPDFDHFLAKEAQALGVDYLDQTEIAAVELSESGARLRIIRNGSDRSLSIGFLIDASGPSGALHRLLSLPEEKFTRLPGTQALFAHFNNVRLLEEIGFCDESEAAPFPIDNAAVHHVFDGGWIWVLRFNNGITSAGVAATDGLARKVNLSTGAEAWWRLLKDLPTVDSQFQAANAITPFIHLPRIAFRTALAAKHPWAMLPSAAGFIDPLLSTGFSLTLLGVSRLALLLEQDWNPERFGLALEHYSRQTLQELSVVEHLVAALYATMPYFERFSDLSLLYFAAVSYSETARRLNRPELASSFLLSDHESFARDFAKCCDYALETAEESGAEPGRILRDYVLRTIANFDIAGLSHLERRRWFPAKAEDLFASAHKLGVGHKEIEELLVRCGFCL